VFLKGEGVMTAKPKSKINNTLAASLLVPIVLALLASPVLVEYIKKTPAPESAPPATVAPASASEPSIVEEQCLKKAWDAFNGAKYESAIKFAEQCIDNFGKAADRAQEKLESENEPLPPTGKVSGAEKDKIFKRGLLNDVATAYFIKGRSAEYLYKTGGPKSTEYKDMAKEAYEATCRYKHARTWDVKGWFWSPCEAASDRLPLK
jgi:hypothetical protein